MKSCRHAALAMILLLALLLRARWAVTLSNDVASLRNLPDQQEYLSLAQNLLAGQGLQFTDPRFGQTVWAYRTPGYPLMVAACGANLRAVRLFQAILDTSTVLAIFLLARNWLTPNWSLLCAAAVAVNPLLIYFSGLILSETLFTAMLAWTMYFLSRADRERLPVGVAILAISVLVRPSAFLLPTILTILAARRHAARWCIAAFALTFLVLVPWAWRNDNRLGQWIWTSTNSGITSYDGFNPSANGASDQSFLRDMPQVAQMGEIQRSDYFHQLADQFIREHPATCLKLTLLKIARFWSPLPWSAEFSRPIYIAAGLIYTLPLLVLTFLGIFTKSTPFFPSSGTPGEGQGGGLEPHKEQSRLVGNPPPLSSPGVPEEEVRDPGILPTINFSRISEGDHPCRVKSFLFFPKSFLFLPAVYFTLIHAASVSSLRYRIPAEPPMTIVAVAVVQKWVARKEH